MAIQGVDPDIEVFEGGRCVDPVTSFLGARPNHSERAGFSHGVSGNTGQMGGGVSEYGSQRLWNAVPCRWFCRSATNIGLSGGYGNNLPLSDSKRGTMGLSTKPKSLKQALKEKGLTETSLIQKGILSKNLMARWQSRERIPRLDNVIRFCAEVGMPIKVFAEAIGLDTTGVPDDVPDPLEGLSPPEVLEVLAAAMGYSVVPAPDTPNDAEQEHRPIPSPQTDGRDTP